MPKVTIQSLTQELNTNRQLRDVDIVQIRNLKERNVQLTEENKALKDDKEWLRRMHSAMLQATAEMFRNR